MVKVKNANLTVKMLLLLLKGILIGSIVFILLYFGGSHYWDIKELDKTIFSFYDRTGELNDPTTSKEYVEFYPYNDGKTNYTTYLIIKKCS